jgi:hypothetical protein
VAGGGRVDLWSSEKELPTAQAGSGHARDAAGDRGRSHSRLTGIGFLWTTEHGFHRAGESDCPTRGGSSRTPDLGHVPTGSTAPGSPGVVASLLPFCTPSCSAAGEARAAARTRGQTAGATLSATDASHGSGKNEPTMDSQGGALVPLAKGFRLRGSQARWGALSCPRKIGEGIRIRARTEPHSRKRRPVWTASSPKTGPKWVCRGLVNLSTISNRSTQSQLSCTPSMTDNTIAI